MLQSKDVDDLKDLLCLVRKDEGERSCSNDRFEAENRDAIIKKLETLGCGPGLAAVVYAQTLR